MLSNTAANLLIAFGNCLAIIGLISNPGLSWRRNLAASVRVSKQNIFTGMGFR
jgi:hypothetical protein